MFRVRADGHSEFVEKKSRFLGFVMDVVSPEAAAGRIAALRKEHFNARHVCFAFQIDGLLRSSDDGEPQGTAGHPIADVLAHSELDHALIAVVRYYGGIQLGTGGLARAYSSTASAACENASLMEVLSGFPLSVSLDYNDFGKVSYFIKDSNIPQISVEYGPAVFLRLMVPSGLRELTEKKLASVTSGRSTLSWDDETSFALCDGELVQL